MCVWLHLVRVHINPCTHITTLIIINEKLISNKNTRPHEEIHAMRRNKLGPIVWIQVHNNIKITSKIIKNPKQNF